MKRIKKGGLVNSHPFGYLRNDLSHILISSLKKRSVNETKAIVFSTILDSFKDVTHPASSKTKKPNHYKAVGLFEHLLRFLNNHCRDNHISYKYSTVNSLNIAYK